MRWRFRFWLTDQRRKLRRLLGRIRTLARPHIHLPDDGRGPRQVYIDGQAVKRVIYADTRKGFVRIHHDPIRFNRKREVTRSFKRLGVVTVDPLGKVSA